METSCNNASVRSERQTLIFQCTMLQIRTELAKTWFCCFTAVYNEPQPVLHHKKLSFVKAMRTFRLCEVTAVVV